MGSHIFTCYPHTNHICQNCVFITNKQQNSSDSILPTALLSTVRLVSLLYFLTSMSSPVTIATWRMKSMPDSSPHRCISCAEIPVNRRQPMIASHYRHWQWHKQPLHLNTNLLQLFIHCESYAINRWKYRQTKWITKLAKFNVRFKSLNLSLTLKIKNKNRIILSLCLAYSVVLQTTIKLNVTKVKPGLHTSYNVQQ